ncbi:hypothetical protein ACFVWN_01385 [Nocardiopsis flavescens]|uniref:hypothetical protein n=1 Tax=Nocardiopsis flavescens TaxID=758803 RepID=UPI00365059B2
MKRFPPLLRIVTVNVQDGGTTNPAGIEHVLTQLFAGVEHAPALIIVNEAKHWLGDGHRLGLRVAAILADIYGPRYQIRVGHMGRAPVPPALLWDPALLALTRWDDPVTSPDNHDMWNRAVFDTAWQGGPLTVMPLHWHPADREQRISSARVLSGLLGGEELVVAAGDTNCSPSGRTGMWPRTDFERMPAYKRHHKGWQPHGPSGPWESHTAPLDLLLGRADPDTGDRSGGIGWQSAIEAAWYLRGRPAGEVFEPTVNPGVDPGGSEVIDHILLSRRLAAGVVPEETRVHLPQGPPVSDHRLVSTAVRPEVMARR